MVRSGSDRRGQSEVIGVVLLLSVTLIGITAVSAAGVGVLADAQGDSQVAQVENSMAQMSSKANLAALDQSGTHSFSLGDTGDGAVSVEEEGSITIEYDTEEESTYIVDDLPLGVVTYERGSTAIAYQGGGVWKKQDESVTMVSPPQFHYRGNTLTFPIITVSGTGAASGSVTGVVEKTGEEVLYPGGVGQNPLEEGEVTIEVHSRYCQGWQEFFEDRTSSAVTESCGNDDTVRVQLDVPDPLVLDRATTYSNFADVSGNAIIESEKKVGSLPAVEPTVDEKVEKCEGGEDCRDLEDAAEDPLTPGEPYYVEVDEGERYPLGGLDFEPGSEGEDIEIIIDGDVEISDELNVDGDTEGTVELYVNGDLNIQNGDINTGSSSGDASRMIMYVTGQIDEPGSGSSEVYAVVFAPNSVAPDGCTGNERWSGSIDFHGVVIVESLCIGGDTDLYYDDNLDGLSLELATESSAIRYLHVTENGVEIDVS